MTFHRLLLLAAPFALLGASRPAPPPDTIYVNGTVLTLNERDRVTEAFAVRGERFVSLGTNVEIRALAGRRTQVVDLGGATAVPGFADNHDHLWNSAKYLHRGVDVIGVTSWDEMRRRLTAALARARPGETLFTTSGSTIRPVPTRAQLDQISSEVPILVVGFRRGNGVFNSAALRRLGISHSNPFFRGARVPVDDRGEPVGTSPRYPNSVLMMDALIPPLGLAEQENMVRLEMARRNALGITSIRELAVWPDALNVLQRMRRRGELTLRIGVGVEFPDQAETANHLAALRSLSPDDPWLFRDSTGEEPWAPAVVSQEAFASLARAAHRLGWRMAPHVNADGAGGASQDDATEATLGAYEAVNRESSITASRWYVEHVPAATPAQIVRMARLGLTVSTQLYGYYGPPNPPLHADRMARYNPIRSFLDAGLLVVSGSDTQGPTAQEAAPNNPLLPFYYYVTRRTLDGALVAPAERISRVEALRIATVNHALAVRQDLNRGPIAPGLLADFVVLDQNPLSVPEEQILAIRVLATYVGARRVFSAPLNHARAGRASSRHFPR